MLSSETWETFPLKLRTDKCICTSRIRKKEIKSKSIEKEEKWDEHIPVKFFKKSTDC